MTPAPGNDHREYLNKIDRFRSVHAEAAAEREQREFPAWLEFEIQAMHNAVNAERAAAGLPPVALAEVRRVEQRASGHIDYARKFALYCADLTRRDSAAKIVP